MWCIPRPTTYQSLLGAPVAQEGLGVLLCHKQGSLLLSDLREETRGASCMISVRLTYDVPTGGSAVP